MLINSLTDNLVLTAMDYNEHRKDTELGASMFELGKLSEDATQEDLSIPILKDGKERGELRFDVSYFPVLMPQVNESGVEELPESSALPPFFCNLYLSVTGEQTLASCDSQFIRPRISIHPSRVLLI